MGVFARLITICMLIVSLNTLLGFGFWLFKMSFTPSRLLWIYLVITVFVVLFEKGPTVSNNWKSWFPVKELVAVVVAIIAGAIVLFPLSTDRSTPALIQAVSTGIDNIAHLNFIEQIEKQQGYVYGSRASATSLEPQLGPDVKAYPEGYHLNAALAEEVFGVGHRNDAIRWLLLNYVLYAAVNFAVLGFCFTYLAALVAEKIVKKKDGLIWLSALIIGVYIILNFALGLFISGFQPQILGLSLLLVCAWLLEAYRDAKTDKQKFFWISCALLVAIGNGFVYLYLWPVAVAVICSIVFWDNYKRVYRPSRLGLSFLLLLALMSFIQAALYLIFSSLNSGKLDDQGGTPMLNNFLLLALIIGLSSIIFARPKRLNRASVQLVFVTWAVLFSIAMLIFQLATSGTLSYYYFKSTYTIVLFVAVLGVSLFVNLLHQLQNRLYIGMALLATVILAWSVHSILLSSFLDKQPYTSPNRPLAIMTVKLLKNPYYRQHTTQIVAIGNDCINADDLRVSRLLMTLSGKATIQQEKIAEYSFWPYDRQVAYGLIASYQRQQPDNKLIIVSSQASIHDAIIKRVGNAATHLTFIDPYAGQPSQAITGCT
jgi:hypothetical protein